MNDYNYDVKNYQIGYIIFVNIFIVVMVQQEPVPLYCVARSPVRQFVYNRPV